MSREANFEIVELVARGGGGKDVYLRDVGPWNKHKTVTNDAEGVVERLIASGVVTSAEDRIFYFDTDDIMDELRHDGEVFIGFGCQAAAGGA